MRLALTIGVLIFLSLLIWKMKMDSQVSETPPTVSQMTSTFPGGVSDSAREEKREKKNDDPVPTDGSGAPRATTAGTSPESAAGGPAGSTKLQAVIREARASLPKLVQMKALTAEEKHSTPPQVDQAGQKLGDLAQHLHDHPAEIPAALPFYMECAQDPEGLPSIRALCYGNLKRHQAHWTPGLTTQIDKIPNNIKDLWSNLQD